MTDLSTSRKLRAKRTAFEARAAQDEIQQILGDEGLAGNPVAREVTEDRLRVVPEESSKGDVRAAKRSADTRQPKLRQMVLVESAVTLLVFFGLASLSGAFDQAQGAMLHFVVPFAVICSAVFMCLYRLKRSNRQVFGSLVRSAADNVRVLSCTALLSIFVILSVDALAPGVARSHLPPRVVVAGFIVCALALSITDYLVQLVFGRSQPVKVIVLGTGVMADDVAARLRRSAKIEVVGFVDDEPMGQAHPLGRLDDLGEVCKRHDIDRVVVAFSHSHPEQIAAALRLLDPEVAVDVVPRFFELTGWESHLTDLHGLAVVTMGAAPSRLSLGVKRALDVIVAAVMLLVATPVLVVVAIAVKLSSNGPVFFRQERVGRSGKIFSIFKFRTMRPAEEAYDEKVLRSREARWQAEEDRKTSVGKFLRRTGIDELPQLFNVVRGDMSLVGPRPLIKEEYFAMPEWAGCRTEMRPGVTGLWQVCGQHELRADELYRLDRQYVREWSPGTDFKILALTPGRLLRGGGRSAIAT